MAGRRSIAVRILGHEYRIRSDADEAQIERVARSVDEAMSRIRERTGTVDTLDGVVAFYLDVATLARRDELRNGAPEIRAVSLTDDDVEPLTAFLAALDEDYD